MPRTLQLTRPLISFDLETTGLNVAEDRIIEMSCVKLLPGGGRDTKTLRLNPTRPISAEATAVHGISDADLAACPTFADVAHDIAQFMEGADLTGFNIERFDIPMLTQEFARVGYTFPSGPTQVVDSWRIFCHFEPRDLSTAYRQYCGGKLDNAHSAEADAQAAADILVAQLNRYPELPEEPEGLHAFCHPVRPDWVDADGKITWLGEDAALGFGKHRGRTLKEMAEQEPDYLRWISKGNFSVEVQGICRQALMGNLPKKPEAQAAPQAHGNTEIPTPAAAKAPLPKSEMKPKPQDTAPESPAAQLGRLTQTSLF
jgi:DNA polymerase-3 subunit epsilon